MSRFQLDTDILIDIEHKRTPATDLVGRLFDDGHELLVSPISVAEFYSGTRRGMKPHIDSLIDRLTAVPLTREDALAAADRRFALARRGVQISLADSLIAAGAVAAGATLVTRNAKDFQMDGLMLLVPPSG